MLKLLRKYKKVLLITFGVLLMVTWLTTGTSSMFNTDPAKMPVAMIGKTKVTRLDADHAARELAILSAIVPNQLKAWEIKDPMHWYLLAREAEKAGLVGGGADGRKFIEDIVVSQINPQTQTGYQTLQQVAFGMIADDLRASDPLGAEAKLQDETFLQAEIGKRMQDPTFLGRATERIRNFTETSIASKVNSARFTPAEGDMIFAKYRGISRLFSSAAMAPRLSDVRAISTARRIGDSVVVDVVTIPGSRIEVPEPTEAELLAHFEKYKASDPTKDPMGIGYSLAPRIKLEWLTVSSSGVEAAIVLDPIAVNKFWQQNRSAYPGEFAVERSKVEAALRKQRLTEVMASVDRVYKAQVQSSTRRLESVGAIKRLPADWEASRPKLSDIAKAIVEGVAAAEKITIPVPSVTTLNATWTELTPEGIRQLPVIGTGALVSQRGSRFFGDLVNQMYELTPNSGVALQVGIPFDAALTTSGVDATYFSILAFKPAGPADSIEDVRARVVADVKSLKGYEKLIADGVAYQTKAAAEGLQAVAAGFPSTTNDGPIAVQAGIDVSRQRVTQFGFLPVAALDYPEFRDATMDTADKLGVSVPLDATTAPLRTYVIAVPKTRSFVVAQITRLQPLTVEAMRGFNGNVFNQLSGVEFGEQVKSIDELFGFEAMKARVGYQDIEGGSKKSASK